MGVNTSALQADAARRTLIRGICYDAYPEICLQPTGKQGFQTTTITIVFVALM